MFAIALTALGCGRIDYGGLRGGLDAGPIGLVDASTRDAGAAEDAEVATLDTDAGPRDSGTPRDASVDEDAGPRDAGSSDAGSSDAGLLDAGLLDAGSSDAGTGTGVVACTPACPAGEYCVVRAECANAGTCRPRPTPGTEMCPAVYAPVCGCDGITYSNGCEAGLAGMTTAFTGTCAGGPIEI